MIIGSLLVAAFIMAAPANGIAGWDVSISIPLPGFYYYPAPAPYGYVPAPPPERAPVFFEGAWYRSSGPTWYISAYSGGPWYVISSAYVPVAVINVPIARGGGGVTVQPRAWFGWGRDGHRNGRGHGHGHGHGHD